LEDVRGAQIYLMNLVPGIWLWQAIMRGLEGSGRQ